ncbi:CBS domain-containing protein [Arcticibacter pallidicorallinus]|uniref:CBS domain-containing protein n=1 Tax=Arcticibacter pallidicorallinus TaxID=1259464 RepID=A0A2T0U3H2_9SPHI|nr:CBS domain-containing protein [Arcticibacter pallidicorallinus]PRY52465.1 CBS domain-containing protein [Arcticibacter pallidicorallinus]
MLANELISEAIPPLKESDSIQRALDRMDEFRVSHLPVMVDGVLLGLISDDDLFEEIDFEASLKSVNINYSRVSLQSNQHIYDVVKVFSESHLTVLPVLDEGRNYLGVINTNTVVDRWASIASIKEPGGIIVLEMDNRNNSLAHIAQIIESESAQILSSYITSHIDSTRTEVTIKVNRTEISGILASLGRYDYHILATFNDNKEQSGTGDRYDQLMNYLSI